MAPAVGKRVSRTLPAALVASLRAAGAVRFVDDAGQAWEWSTFKTRYVRTVAGSKRYGLPIGSPIVGKGRKPKSGGGGDKPAGGGDSEGGGGEGAPPKPAPAKPAVKEPGAKKPAAKKAAGGVKLTPAQRDAAERHLGREPGGSRGAYLDGNQVVVEDRDAAVKELDHVLAGDDLTPGERKAHKNLRDKIAAHPGGDKPAVKADDKPSKSKTPDKTPEAAPGPPPAAGPAARPKLSEEDLKADWEKNGPKLSEREDAAIKEYADAAFYEMNGLLRGNATDLLEQDSDAEYLDRLEVEYRDKVNAIRDAQSRYRTPGAATLYRRVPNGVLPDATMQPGDVFRDKAFLSTSTRKNPGTFTNHPVLMEIDVPAGTPAINVYAAGHGLPAEREILLPPGLKLQVVSDETKNGERWVRMTAVPV